MTEEKEDELDEREYERTHGYAPTVGIALLSVLLVLCGILSSVVLVFEGQWGLALFTGPVLWALAALVRKW
jgi:hypothetical protein